jgi:ADP-ribosylglycohydrolase
VPQSEDADYFREKAAQCRRLAAAITHQNDPAVAALLALAVEFEAKAVALTAEDASAKQVEILKPESDK